PREVDPNPGPHGAQNEGGHEAERGSDPPPDRPAHRRPERPDDSFHITGLRAWSVPESGGDCHFEVGVPIFTSTYDIAFGPRGNRADRVMNLPRTIVPAGANALDRALCFYSRRRSSSLIAPAGTPQTILPLFPFSPP